jgi:hypothetical protein
MLNQVDPYLVPRGVPLDWSAFHVHKAGWDCVWPTGQVGDRAKARIPTEAERLDLLRRIEQALEKLEDYADTLKLARGVLRKSAVATTRT